MKRLFISLFSCFAFGVFLFSCSQPAPDAKSDADTAGSDSGVVRSPASFFPAERAMVLVVGTFHFDYPGLDAHQTDAANKVDVLSEPRQREVQEVLDHIKKFRPNKMALEAWPSWDATAKLKAYKEGRLELGRDERHQLGLRLAAEVELDTLYSIDADNLANELGETIPDYMESMFEGFDFKSDDPMDTLIMHWMEYDDLQAKSMNLLDYIKYINTPESHQYNYGIYLTGDFKLGEHRGADILAAWWYNRNLRMFRKIQNLSEGPGDRIVVLVGNGHAAVLRQLLECSPEFEFIEFSSL